MASVSLERNTIPPPFLVIGRSAVRLSLAWVILRPSSSSIVGFYEEFDSILRGRGNKERGFLGDEATSHSLLPQSMLDWQFKQGSLILLTNIYTLRIFTNTPTNRGNPNRLLVYLASRLFYYIL